MREPKEKIKMLGPITRFLATLALGVVLTLIYLRCNYNNDIVACDVPVFTSMEVEL